jgi:hypothetical protein
MRDETTIFKKLDEARQHIAMLEKANLSIPGEARLAKFRSHVAILEWVLDISDKGVEDY